MSFARTVLMSLALTSVAASWAHAQQFSAEEREAIVRYWKAPGRFKSETVNGVDGRPAYQVFLTPETSTWFWKYQRAIGAGKLPPTVDGSSAPVDKAEWEKWVSARLEYDRGLAQAYVEANVEKVGTPRIASRGVKPLDPGMPPTGLATAVGAPPPRFALPKIPINVTVSFEDPDVSL
ncbi:MAG: hypothetical protein ABJA67_01985, partial [Chthonomonadales bacterium]